MIKVNRIGIIGGSGYIGSSLAKTLRGDFSVKIIDVNPPKDNLENIAFVECDITEYEDLEKAVSDVDVIIHSAIIQIPLINKKKRLAYDVNFVGTQNVCKVVDKTPRIKGMILAGTWHVIGEK